MTKAIACLVACGATAHAADEAVTEDGAPDGDVAITEGEYEGRPQFVIRTGGNTFSYDRAGGGFSRAIDRDGNDWITFKKDPLSLFPESAGAGYRGIPNLVFGGPDGGAGHPGHDQCTSELASPTSIRTESISGTWAWTWTFSSGAASLRVERASADHPWWFLYEGTPGGKFAPSEQFWGSDSGGPNRSIPDSKSQLFGHWRWAYFGSDSCPRVLAVTQREPDEVDDTLWYLGSSEGGAATAPDGMVVFGFGRNPGAKPALHGTRNEFTVVFIESTDHAEIAEAIGSRLPQ